MKNVITVRYLIFLVIISICCNQRITGQNQVDIIGGIGVPELINIGANVQFDQTQIGLKIGSFPSDESLFSFSADFYYHFAGTSELSSRRPWYMRAGLNYLRNETKTRVEKYSYLNLRIGREFNISNKIGIDVDAGIVFQISYSVTEKEPSTSLSFNFGRDTKVFPGIGAEIFYRL